MASFYTCSLAVCKGHSQGACTRSQPREGEWEVYGAVNVPMDQLWGAMGKASLEFQLKAPSWRL